jgi:hypothetical protein
MFRITLPQPADSIHKIVWIGGWASSVACWKASIQEQYPNREHVYYDIADLLLDPTAVQQLESNLSSSTALVGWSTGSLWIHRWMGQQDRSNWKGLSIHSISPVFTFCATQEQKKGWPVSVVNRMIQLIQRSPKFREGVLQDFWKSMVRGSRIPDDQKEHWWVQAQRLSEEQLVAGLEFLRDVTVDIAGLEPWKEQWSLYIDKEDPIAIWNTEIEKKLNSFSCSFHNQGHVPLFS